MSEKTNAVDTFISFAHVDDARLSGNDKGWITHFVNNLRKLVTQKLGREENYRLWKDFQLKGSDAITPEIKKQIQNSHTLLICLSPGWLASTWCRKELRLFCESRSDVNQRIFVVELDALTKEDKPAVLHDLLAYRFWWKNDEDKIRPLGFPVPQSTDQGYYDRLLDLSNELATTLKAIQSDNPEPVSPPKATIYVAPVSDALFSRRENLINGLKQYDIAVQPRNNALDNDFENNLVQCSHFVQLLDNDSMIGIPSQQFEAAQTAGKPILQWRDPGLDDSGKHTNSEHKQLLESKTVIAVPLPDFIHKIYKTVLPEPIDPPPPDNKKMIFVHAGQEDYGRAQQVAEILKNKGYGIALPRYQGEPERIRKSIERGFQYCDILLVIQQIVSADVVEDFLADALAYAQKRETRPPVLICHDNKAEALTFIPSGAQTLECHTDFHEHCLEQFLARVKA